MGKVLKFDLPTWKTMRMLQDDNAWMRSNLQAGYDLAVNKNLSCIKTMIHEAYEQAA